MARGIQVRSITTLADSRVEVAFTAGPLPLPAGQSGTVIYRNQTAIQDAIKAFESELTDGQLLLLHLAITWLQPNGSFGNVNQVLNKQLQLDTTAASVIKIA